MRNTLQEQYNLLKEGKGNKQQFFKSARHLFPDLITPVNTYEDTVRILKNRGIIAEGIGGVVTKGKTPDWHQIFKENMNSMDYGSWKKELMNIIKKDANLDDNEISVDEEEIKRYYKEGKSPNEVYNNIWLKDAGNFRSLNEAKEAKAEEKETTKEVTDMATRGYDYKDEKNYDNVFGQEFLQGYYTEMKDPKNEGKHVEELRQIVAKNLAKDINYYVKNGQFGTKDIGYTVDAPGLGETKPAKGKHKSSGYGDLKESVLRSQIYLLVKEVLSEAKFEVGDTVTYKGDKYEITRFIDDRIYIKSLKHGGRGDSWVKASDLQKEALAEEENDHMKKYRLGVLKSLLATAEKEGNKDGIEYLKGELGIKDNQKEALTPADEMAFSQAVDFAEDLYDKVGNVEDVLANLPKQFIQYKDELEQHLTQKFEG